MSPDLMILRACVAEGMEIPISEVDDTQVQAILIGLNRRRWFLVDEAYTGPRFTEAEIDHIQELAREDWDDAAKEVRVRLDEGDWEGVSRWANKVAMNASIETKIVAALPFRNAGSNPVTSGQR